MAIDDKVRLNRASVEHTSAKTTTETKEPDVKTTVKDPSVTTETSATYSPFRKVDGSIDQSAVNEFNTNYRDPLANAYDIDPVTGRYKGDVGALLGFDPEKYKAEQEAKAKLERFKQKEAGWRNALGVVTDIATAAAGGNVYKRDKDKIAKESGEAADKANLTVQGLGKAVDDAVKGRELQYEQERAKAVNQYIKDFATKMKQTTTQGGAEQTTTQGGGKVTSVTGGDKTVNGYRETLPRTVNGRGSGSGSGKSGTVVMSIPKQDVNGNHTGYSMYEVPEKYAKAYMGQLQNSIKQLIETNDEKKKKEKNPKIDELKTNLLRQGVLQEKDGEYVWISDANRFYNLTSSFANVDARLDKMLQEVIAKGGQDVKFAEKGHPVDGGWGGAAENEEDDFDM